MIPINNKVTSINFNYGYKESIILLGDSYITNYLSYVKDYASEAIIIADNNVNKIWKNEIFNTLKKFLPTHIFFISPFEKSKTLSTVQSLLDKILKTYPKRSSIIISFGGGLTGNIAGMVAGLLFRGTKLIHIPTTLLSMSDSILSQKQAVNGCKVKNSFGVFHTALLNFIDIKYLDTLPHQQIYSGIIELVKNCLAFDKDSIDYLSQLIIAPFNKEDLKKLILLGIKQKQKLLAKDPYEQNIGIIFEYGHTIGHSFELNIFNLHHGQAVGLGMLVSAYISYSMNLLSIEDIRIHVKLLKKCNCPLRISCKNSVESLLKSIKLDNKRGKIYHNKNEIPMVILEDIGSVKKNNDYFLMPVSLNTIKTAIEVLQTNYFLDLLLN